MNPIILAFNIRHSVHKQFGVSLFKHAKQRFGIHLLPIVTAMDEGIEDRALKLQKEVPRLLEKLKTDKAHFACYSSCGVDFRYAISELGLAPNVQTLTTISSPHKGSRLALLSDRKFFADHIIDPISRLSGIGLRPFHEFTVQNMRNFNKFVKDSPQVKYFSIGSEKSPNQCSYTLKDTGKYLQYKTIPNMVYHNDGVFGHDEITWGEHLVNFELDHGQVIGVYGNQDCQSLKTVKEVVQDYHWVQNQQSQ